MVRARGFNYKAFTRVKKGPLGVRAIKGTFILNTIISLVFGSSVSTKVAITNLKPFRSLQCSIQKVEIFGRSLILSKCSDAVQKQIKNQQLFVFNETLVSFAAPFWRPQGKFQEPNCSIFNHRRVNTGKK